LLAKEKKSQRGFIMLVRKEAESAMPLRITAPGNSHGLIRSQGKLQSDDIGACQHHIDELKPSGLPFCTMSAQASFFDQGNSVLLDGEFGRIEYFPAQLTLDTAIAWFHQLQEAVLWQTERRQMYDREVDVPRLFAKFSLDEAQLPEPILSGAILAGDVAGCSFDSAGLNLYRDEHDSVAWHNDRLHYLHPGAPIAILSLGSTRRMAIRTKRMPRRTLHVDLEPGSILLMSYATQLHLDHAILKQREKVGTRISIAFRKRPQPSTPALNSAAAR
jgi:alkylated DNA repair dioxygenase AlkB